MVVVVEWVGGLVVVVVAAVSRGFSGVGESGV